MPDLRHLRVLRTVGLAGSFSAAADELHYTQPAVSKIVSGLERELGTTLVDRGLRPLRLTDAGEALSRRAEAALAELAAAEEDVHAIANLGAGRIRVATFSSAGTGFVVDALRRFRGSHPDVDVGLREIGMPSAMVRALRQGEIDLGITFDYPEAGDEIDGDLEAHTLQEDPFDLVVHRRHRLAKLDSIPFEELAGEHWLLPEFGPTSPSFRMIDRRCTEAGFEPRIAFRINDCHMTQAMVAAGEGVALLPRLMLKPRHTGVAIRRLSETPPIRRIVAIRLPGRYLTPATERFIELLKQTGAKASAPL